MDKATKYAEWWVKRRQFEFEDSDGYEAWKQNPKVNLHFFSDKANDKGAAVFESTEKVSFSFEMTPDTHSIEIYNDEKGPCITASVFFPIDSTDPDRQLKFKAGLDEETLREWGYDQSGEECVELDLGFDNVSEIEDESGGWRIATAAEIGPDD